MLLVEATADQTLEFAQAVGGIQSCVRGVCDEHELPVAACFELNTEHPIVGYRVAVDCNGMLHGMLHCVSLCNHTMELIDNTKSHAYSNFVEMNTIQHAYIMYHREVGKILNKTTPGGSDMFYVYALVDPRNNKPFYVGKGKGRRAWHHLRPGGVDGNPKKQSKIDKIRSMGLEPLVSILAADIEDESFAYDLEEMYIKHMRPDLTNICDQARPPNHKGKTDVERYGAERAAARRLSMSQLQKDRGGFYSGRTHSDATRKRLSDRMRSRPKRVLSEQQRQELSRRFSDLHKGVKQPNTGATLFIDWNNQTLHVVYGKLEIADFIASRQLSWSSFQAAVRKGWPTPTKGMNAGWSMVRLPNIRRGSNPTKQVVVAEVSAIKQDLTSDTFAGFEF